MVYLIIGTLLYSRSRLLSILTNQTSLSTGQWFFRRIALSNFRTTQARTPRRRQILHRHFQLFPACFAVTRKAAKLEALILRLQILCRAGFSFILCMSYSGEACCCELKGDLCWRNSTFLAAWPEGGEHFVQIEWKFDYLGITLKKSVSSPSSPYKNLKVHVYWYAFTLSTFTSIHLHLHMPSKNKL